jgi:antitoxin HigA-1
MLREDFLPDYKLTVSGFAKAIGVSQQTVNGYFGNAEL